jgi:endoglucanase
MKKLTLLIVLLGVGQAVIGQTRAHEINERLGRGVNLGNSFEAPRDQSWGVEVEAADLKNIAEHGFSHVRIPVRWNDWASTSPPYTIETEFMDTIRKVVDAALENKLHAMVNIHHYDDFNDNPDGTHLTRFLAMWKQISQEFSDYPDSLLFEFLNEPHVNMDAAHWNPIFKRVLDTVRVDNPTRICVVGPPDWNNVNSVDKLVWTADTNMILTVHYYNPFQFTHQGASWVGDQSQDWLGTTWDSTASQRQAVIDDFAKVRAFSEQYNVPVHVGEFGAYSAADNDSRARWTAYCARTFESFGFSWAYWEYQAGFGVYDPANGMWRNYLLNALTEQIDPNSILPEPWEIRNGSFTNGITGWGLNVQGEAAATSEEIGEKAVISVTASDGTDWHVQLAQNGLRLIQGAEYRLSFDAWADDPGEQVTAYLGQSISPYAAYSGFETFMLSTGSARYSFTFTMNDPSDPNARVVFNLGHDAGIFYLDSIVLEQLFVPVLVEDLEIAPNPAAITEKDGSIQLSVNVIPENANNQEVTWEVVAGGSLATISSEGLLTATGTGDGIVKVRVTAADGSGITAELILEVTNQLLVESITLNPTKTVIDNLLGAARIFFEVLPANASNKTLYWEDPGCGYCGSVTGWFGESSWNRRW